MTIETLSDWQCPCCGARAPRRGSRAPAYEKHGANCSYAYRHGLPRERLLSTAERYALAAQGRLGG
jgi:hypothetical protein